MMHTIGSSLNNFYLGAKASIPFATPAIQKDSNVKLICKIDDNAQSRRDVILAVASITGTVAFVAFLLLTSAYLTPPAVLVAA